MLRRLLIGLLVVIIALVIAADRVGASVASHVLAGKLQTDEHLPNRPDTSINGIPFLTQAFGGKYSDIAVTAHELPVNGVPVTTLTAHLHGVHLPFSKVVRGSVSQVPVDRVDGSVFVSFADANRYLAAHRVAGMRLVVRPGTGDNAIVVARGTVAGRHVTARGAGAVQVSNDLVTISVAQVSGAGAAAISRLLPSLHADLPLQGIPFQMQLESVHATTTGLTGTGVAHNVVLGQH